MRQGPLITKVGIVGALAIRATIAAAQDAAPRQRILVTSSIDGSRQPSNLFVPAGADRDHPAPLAVLLHTWSTDLDQRHPVVEQEARARGWLLLAPNFRGKNDHPEACGSTLAQQDVLDAVQWVVDHYPVDKSRIYVLGLSGGGHMTLLMVGRAPKLWAAASAWVGIADLADYQSDHAADEYGAMARQCLGGAPEQSDRIRADYRARSPTSTLGRAGGVPVDIAAGRSDPDVKMVHSIRAFNVLAAATGAASVTEREIEELSAPGEGLSRPTPADTTPDPAFGRRIYLRRQAGPSRLTIFEGGHEWVPRAAIGWLAAHHR